MGSADQLFNRFVDAWNAGKRPDVDDYLAQIPEPERPEFLQMVSLFLEEAPVPPLSDEQREQVRAQPAYQRSVKLAESKAGLWSTLLPRLREKAKLTREQLVAALSTQLGITSQEQRVKLYYHRMETGQLDPSGVSHRVLDALAKLLHADVGELEEAGDFRGIAGPQPAAVFMRSDMDGVEAVEAAPESPGLPDEVDLLFTGGR
jgi:hypothetical protein